MVNSPADQGGEKSLPESGRHETDSDRLRRTTRPEVLSVGLVSAFAGDRAMTATEEALIRKRQRIRGDGFFSDLIYAVSHHYVRPELAEDLWNKVLCHKSLISRQLGRKAGVVVAALDYLSNITNGLKSPTLISENCVSEIVNFSMRDGMTGLFNHSACYELLALELEKHRREDSGVALLLLDIDNFKTINDESGHQQGDRILVALAGLLTQEARRSDICCRLGGDEFVVILRLTSDAADAAEAYEIAERVRAEVASRSFDGRAITISVGVALCDRTTVSHQELIERADQALYAAKTGGRNQVATWGSSTQTGGPVRR